MKVFCSTSGDCLDDPVGPIFGRAKQYLVVDTDTMETSIVANPAVNAAGGAGVQSAQYVMRQGAEAIISGNVGPNPMQVFNPAGIPVFIAESGSIRDAVAAMQSGDLPQVGQPTVNKDFGKTGKTLTRGPGQGRNGGRGMGKGRG